MTKTDELNRLEQEAVDHEDALCVSRWKQAEVIVARLENETEREIAASWINRRTGKPYTQVTVHQFAVAWQKFEKVPFQDRPPFWSAVERALATSTRVQRNESQAPTTPETARKLVANIVAKSPPEVQRAIADEIVKQPTADRSLKSAVKPQRSAREATAHDALADASSKSGDVGFALWAAKDRLMDQPPTPEDRVRLLSLIDGILETSERNGRIAASLRRLVETGDFDEELQALLEEASR